MHRCPVLASFVNLNENFPCIAAKKYENRALDGAGAAMAASIYKLSSLFLSITVLLLGHGLQQTLIPLQGQALGMSSAAIGMTGATYFIGFILGCYAIPVLIRQVGHIRVFAFCVALLIVSILSIARWPEIWFWLGLRAVTGAAMAGLYMIFESWLNEQAPASQRGSVLSFYGFVCIAALVLGQMLLFDAPLLSGASLVALIFAASVAPVVLTTSVAPSVPESVHPDFHFTYRASQVGLLCAAASGVVMGLLWSNGAVYASSHFDDPDAGARFIFWMLVGGLICQVPVGRLSDRLDRRWVLLALSLIGFFASGYWLLRGEPAQLPLLWVAAILGATAMPMYSLAIAHANDNADGRFLQIAGAMLVANGLGSAFGPSLYALLNSLGMHNALFIIVASAYALTLLWTGYRLWIHKVTRGHFERYQLLPDTTQSAAELDPRSGEQVNQEPLQ